MPLTVLITGFGPFPGAPFNPTIALVRELARIRRPAFAGMRRIAHVFPTSYAAVDRDLPALLARLRPDVVLMFGLAARTRHVRVETTARNAIAQTLPDVHGRHRAAAIARGKPGRVSGAAPFARLVSAAHGKGVAVRLSCDAGRYLCNYLYWRALAAADAAPKRPLVQFVHVPLTRRLPRPVSRIGRGKPALASLVKAGEGVLLALASAARGR